MKKRWIVFWGILLFMISIQVSVLGGRETQIGGDFSYEYMEDNHQQIRILRYNGNQKILQVPELIDGKPIVEIGQQAFYGNKTLEQVFFQGKELKIVKQEAFYRCVNLSVVDFSKSSVEKINDQVFFECRKLAQVSFPDTLQQLGERVFWECSSLKNVTFGKGLKSIGQMAFYGCTSLKQIFLPDGFEALGSIDGSKLYGGVFYGCVSLEQATIGSGVQNIPANTFYGCTNLKRVVMPDTVIEIGGHAFAHCRSLKYINFSIRLEKIGAGAFNDCENIQKLVFPDSLIEINSNDTEAERTFSGCISLKKVYFGKNLEKLGSYAFADCTELQEVVIPEKIRWLFPGVFENCKSLKAIYCMGNVPEVMTRALANCNRDFKFYYLTGASGGNKVYPSELYQKQSIFYTVTLVDRETGNVLDTSLVRKGERMSAPLIPQKEGYVFSSWINIETGSIWNFSKDKVNRDLRFGIIWDRKDYLITFDSTEGTLKGDNQKMVTYESKIGVLPVPIRKDYKFMGWYTELNGEGRKYNESSKMPAKDLILYAKWNLNPEKPKAVKVTGNAFSPTEIKLLWKKVKNADGYDIYRSNSENGTYVKIASASAKAAGYVNIGLTKGKTYYYRVRTYRILNDQKFYGAYSNKVKINLTGRPAKAVLTVKKKDEHTIDLSWEKVKGADGYVVYYKTKKSADLKEFASFKSNIYGCYHTNLKENRTYYYGICAYTMVNGKKVYGEMSEVKSLYLGNR